MSRLIGAPITSLHNLALMGNSATPELKRIRGSPIFGGTFAQDAGGSRFEGEIWQQNFSLLESRSNADEFVQ